MNDETLGDDMNEDREKREGQTTTQFFIFSGLLVGWMAIQAFLLPKFGAST